MVDGLSTGEDHPLGRRTLREAKGAAATLGRDPQASVHGRPRLLVSVRSADEALAALAGGADIIDVKEPLRGPLGMADVDSIAEVVACVAGQAPVSAALGELRDWTADSGITVSPPVLPSGLTFTKLGLAGSACRADWVTNWLAVRAAFEREARRRLPWIAVAYADAVIANSPRIDDSIAAAARTGCTGVLIDTYEKSRSSVLDLLSAGDLRSLRALAHSRGLFFALAGRIGAADFRRQSIRMADIVGVRSAACTRGDRTQTVSTAQVALLRERLQSRDKIHTMVE